MPDDLLTYPVNLVLEGRPCLVVGAGGVAARKTAGLLECGARVHVVATRLGAAMRSLGDDPAATISFEQRPYEPGEVAGYRLAVAATDDEDVNYQVYRDGEKAGVWVNSADDPGSCSYTSPAVLRRGSVVVAVSTGGASPALAAWLRDRLEGQVEPEVADLARLLSEEREAIHGRGSATEGLDWQGAISSDMLELLRTGQVDVARERLRACLSSS